MKKRKLRSIALLPFFAMSLGVMIGCNVVNTDPTNPTPDVVEKDDLDAQIRVVYDLALREGKTTLSYDEWLESIKGADGAAGKTAYELYKEVNPDYTGTLEDWLASLRGPQGPKGDQGDPGLPGTNGATWITGAENPTNAQGKTGDLYLNTTTYDIFVKGENAWTLIGNIKGPQGEPGQSSGGQGQQGEPGHSPVITIGENGNWFIDGVDTGKPSQGVSGQNGQNGTTPTVTIGDNGNWFINGQDTGKPSQGAQGQNGVNGTTPTVTIGDNGNWFINGQDTGKPSQGADGQNGVNGQPGTSFISGEGTPDAAIGNEGDSYLDYTTWNFYKKENGAWVLKGNMSAGGGQGGGEDPHGGDTPVTYTVIAGLQDNLFVDGTAPLAIKIDPTIDQAQAVKNGELTARSSDESVATVNLNTMTVAGLSAGEAMITVTYKGVSYSFKATVRAKQVNLVSIAIESYPTKRIYEVGDTFDAAGLAIKAEYSDGSSSTLGLDAIEVSTPDMRIAGTKIVTVAYQEKTVTFGIEVKEKEPVIADNYVNLDIYAVNDFHGHVFDDTTALGLSKTATLLKQQMADDDNSLLISQGDMWQGSVASNYTRGNLVTEWMNELGFASMTVGNHEFDWGEQGIVDNADLANFPMLGINVYKNGSKVDYLDSSTVVEKDGIKIGIIGAIGNCLSSIDTTVISGITFITGDELTNLVKAESQKLRNEQDCDFIIYSYHGSGTKDDHDTYDLELSTGGYVDLVLEGHTHDHDVYKDRGNVWHAQYSAYNKEFGHMTVKFDKNNNNSYVYTVEPETYYTSRYADLVDDRATLALFEKYKDQYEFAYEVVGTNSIQRDGNYLRKLVAYLYAEYGKKKWADKDIVLGGGYISIRSPKSLPAGGVTYADLVTLFPFDNKIQLCTIKGSDLLSKFINSTNDNYFIGYTAYGIDIKNNIDSNETYYIITDTYSSGFASNNVTAIEDYDQVTFARDLLKDYIQKGGLNNGVEAHAGTFADPFDLNDVEINANNNLSKQNDKFVTAKVASVEEATINEDGSYHNVAIKDDDGHNYTLGKLYKFDGADNNTGWKIGDLKVNDEVEFFAGFAKYGESVKFFDAVAVKLNGNKTAGYDQEHAASVLQQYMYNEDPSSIVTGQTYYLKGTVMDFGVNNGYVYATLSGKHTNVNYAVGNYDVSFTHPGDTEYAKFKAGATLTVSFTKAYGEDGSYYYAYQFVAVEAPARDGTILRPYNVADALEFAAGRSSSNKFEAYFKITVSQAGDVVSNTSGDIRNVYVKDKDANNSMLVYFISKTPNSTLYGNWTGLDDLKVGDELLVHGYVYSYKGTLEFDGNTKVYAINNQLTFGKEVEHAISVDDFYTYANASINLTGVYVNTVLRNVQDQGSGNYVIQLWNPYTRTALGPFDYNIGESGLVLAEYDHAFICITDENYNFTITNYGKLFGLYLLGREGNNQYVSFTAAGFDGSGVQQFTGTVVLHQGEEFYFAEFYSGLYLLVENERGVLDGEFDRYLTYDASTGKYTVNEDFSMTIYLKAKDISGRQYSVWLAVAE